MEDILTFLHALEADLLASHESINLHKWRLNLGNLENSSVTTALNLILESLSDHNYSKVLEVDLSKIGLSFNSDNGLLYFMNEDNLELVIERQFILLFVGLSALNEFVRVNICGPNCGEKEVLQTTIFEKEPFNYFKSLKTTKDYLNKFGELHEENTLFPNLLCVSIACLQSMDTKVDPTYTRRWWLLRCIILHQRILPEKIASFYDEMVSLSEELIKMEWIQSKKPLLLLAHVEAEQLHLLYDRIGPAKKALESAQVLTELSVKLSGAYGKRTQYQQKLVPQLFVKVQREKDESSNENSNESSLEKQISRVKLEDLPSDLQLQDDTLLNDVIFSNGDPTIGSVPNLSFEDELVLYGECSLLNKSSASDELKLDEVSPFIRAILSIPYSSWSVRYSTLALRCRLERKSSRRADRALRQLESLLTCIQKPTPPLPARLCALYAAATPFKSDIQGNLADLLVSLGAIKTALEVFQQLGRWEDVVGCLRQLDRTKEAVEILEERLAREETPLLYCLLGDVLDDPEMYKKAGNLSKLPNPRSLRSLGYYYYRRKEYKECVPFFQQSVDVNYLQPQVWFALGYSALQLEDYNLAAKAYRQVVSLDADDFQGWNNLSHAYIRSGQKKRAWSSLQEALKCNYEEWRVWENFLLVCVDIGAFDDAIRAYHRLLDIKTNKHVDRQVLEILVTAVVKDIADINGKPASRLKQNIQELFGRITSVVRKDDEVWKLYSMLIWPDTAEPVDVETMTKACMFQQQALVCCSSSNMWTTEFNAFKNVLEVCLRNAKMVLCLLSGIEDLRVRGEKKTGVKLTTKGIITRAEKGLINFQDSNNLELRELLDSVIATHDELLKF